MVLFILKQQKYNYLKCSDFCCLLCVHRSIHVPPPVLYGEGEEKYNTHAQKN